jgi:hypothetical protein
MVKSAATRKTKRSGYRVIGTMPDGVKILAQPGKATHFTTREIRQAIDKVLRERTPKTESGE